MIYLIDFQLSTYLGYLIASGSTEEYVIISGDKGYDYVHQFWKERGKLVIRRSTIVEEKVDNIAVQLKLLLPEEHDKIGDISKIIEEGVTKQAINNALVQIR